MRNWVKAVLVVTGLVPLLGLLNRPPDTMLLIYSLFALACLLRRRLASGQGFHLTHDLTTVRYREGGGGHGPGPGGRGSAISILGGPRPLGSGGDGPPGGSAGPIFERRAMNPADSPSYSCEVGGGRRPLGAGFTLIELLVVIAILGILVALLLPAR
jgi:prepilin-type N-terminal cleavage/methylation domain-containing protein